MGMFGTMLDMSNVVTPGELVGRIVTELIADRDETYAEAAAGMPMALPTLQRLRRDGRVRPQFRRRAERYLDLPPGLFDAILAVDLPRIERMQGLDERLRTEILAELDPPPAKKITTRRRK